MTTISIVPIPDSSGGFSYRALAAGHQSGGKTPGEALDGLAAQLDDHSSTLVILQKQRPDQFFTAQQRSRLDELMKRWREARDSGRPLSPAEQGELDGLVEAELHASTRRAEALANEAGR